MNQIKALNVLFLLVHMLNEQRIDSDIDLVIISDRKKELLINTTWTSVFGNPITPITFE